MAEQLYIGSATGGGNRNLEKLHLEKFLNRLGKREINQTDCTGQTAFSKACELNRIKIVKFLLKNNRVDYKKANNDGFTPYELACKNNNFEVVILLKLKYLDDGENLPDESVSLTSSSTGENPTTLKRILPSSTSKMSQVNKKSKYNSSESQKNFSTSNKANELKRPLALFLGSNTTSNKKIKLNEKPKELEVSHGNINKQLNDIVRLENIECIVAYAHNVGLFNYQLKNYDKKQIGFFKENSGETQVSSIIIEALFKRAKFLLEINGNHVDTQDEYQQYERLFNLKFEGFENTDWLRWFKSYIKINLNIELPQEIPGAAAADFSSRH